MSTHPEKAVKDLYKAYLHKILRPESALEISTKFVMDLINLHGEKLDSEHPMQPDWVQFAPFKFILSLNELLAKYKEAGEEGFNELSETERTILYDSHLLLSSLITAALLDEPDAYPNEERFQIPKLVADSLRKLCS